MKYDFIHEILWNSAMVCDIEAEKIDMQTLFYEKATIVWMKE
jgi:hypothetical protein